MAAVHYTLLLVDMSGSVTESGQADALVDAAKSFTDGTEWLDEWYIFRDEPYSRAKLHIILSMYPDSFKPNQARKDNDYPIAWCHEVGKGKVFYTSMGHRRESWRDPRFQDSLMGGLKWALGLVPGDATPSAKEK